MRLILSLALLSCGPHGGAQAPKARPVVRLVRCVAATPPPQLGTPASTDEGKLEIDDGEVRFSLASRRVVTIGSVTTTGGDGARITATVRTKLVELTRCYASEGPLRAAIVYKLAVAADGTVSNVDAAAPVLTGTVETCVRRALRSLVFPSTGVAIQVTVPLVFDSTDTFKPPSASSEQAAWTPYAIDTAPPTPAATTAARGAEAAMRGRIAAIDRCFPGPLPSGSLRVMLELGAGGGLDGVRTGGLGDAAAEACVTKALDGFAVITAQEEHVEVACDLARGDAQPWRVAPSAGYSVIDAERHQLRHGAMTLVPGASDPESLPPGTYVVLVRPDTAGAMIQLALLWAADAHAVVLALADNKNPPVFLGLGQTSVGAGDDADASVHPALRVNRTVVSGCVGRTTQTAKLADAGAISALVNQIAQKCRTVQCTPTLSIAVDSDAMARDLVELTGAARRAGFDRVLFGGSELGCQSHPAPPPLKFKRRPISGPDIIDP